MDQFLTLQHIYIYISVSLSLSQSQTAELEYHGTVPTLRLLNALNSEDRGLKGRFSLATIAFDRESAQMSQILSSQGKNALFSAFSNLKVLPKGPNPENIQSRLKFSISLEIFNLV